jgi:hypothetical protein
MVVVVPQDFEHPSLIDFPGNISMLAIRLHGTSIFAAFRLVGCASAVAGATFETHVKYSTISRRLDSNGVSILATISL